MSDALINKYRPKKFDEVIGHNSVVAALGRAVENKTAHTFLFTGPSGVGKTTLARIAAKAAGCATPDILEVDAATNTGIDAMRVIAEGMTYGPIAGKAKAIIVDEIHALSKQAFQSLLKSLEEPPSWGYWMLCTTEPTKVPVAIRNRCFPVVLKPIPKNRLVELLTDIAATEKLKGKQLKSIIELCAEQAEGSARQAINNLAVSLGASDADEAAELLQSSEADSAGIDLARFLSKGPFKWHEIQPVLAGLKDQNAEGIRQVVRAYFTTMALRIPRGTQLDTALRVLEAFSQPCNPQDGVTPIILACEKLRVR